MKVFPGWNPLLWRRRRSAGVAEDFCVEGAPASGLEDLQTRLNQWSRLWTADSEQDSEQENSVEARQLVAERLGHWLERCFGRHVSNSLLSRSGRISLASATPIFTAFLGRRATRELSRHVLQDV